MKRTTMAHEESKLFSPLKIGEKTVKNRLVVAPMSRHRAALSGVPTELNVEYYRQRASAGLIVTEGTAPSAMSRGYLLTQGLYEDAHVEGWRRVTDAVHGGGGTIFVQIMHAGRIYDTLLLEGEPPVPQSAVAPPTAEQYDSPWTKPKNPYCVQIKLW